jgi:membrane protease YdiL (CAAX protease family)
VAALAASATLSLLSPGPEVSSSASSISSPAEARDVAAAAVGALAATTLGPYLEERVFRGFVLPAASAGLGSPWGGVVVSSLAFSAYHVSVKVRECLRVLKGFRGGFLTFLRWGRGLHLGDGGPHFLDTR